MRLATKCVCVFFRHVSSSTTYSSKWAIIVYIVLLFVKTPYTTPNAQFSMCTYTFIIYRVTVICLSYDGISFTARMSIHGHNYYVLYTMVNLYQPNILELRVTCKRGQQQVVVLPGTHAIIRTFHVEWIGTLCVHYS